MVKQAAGSPEMSPLATYLTGVTEEMRRDSPEIPADPEWAVVAEQLPADWQIWLDDPNTVQGLASLDDEAAYSDLITRTRRFDRTGLVGAIHRRNRELEGKSHGQVSTEHQASREAVIAGRLAVLQALEHTEAADNFRQAS